MEESLPVGGEILEEGEVNPPEEEECPGENRVVLHPTGGTDRRVDPRVIQSSGMRKVDQ